MAVATMKITWFDTAATDGKIDPDRDRTLVNGWVKDNQKELHEIHHLAMDHEIEAVKIIAGNQKIDKGGRIIIGALELHFLKDLILALRTVEIQDPGSYKTRRTATQLGYIEVPCCKDDSGDSKPITKKEIK
jgi:hypothetical protein